MRCGVQKLLLECGFRFVYPLLARLPPIAGQDGARWWGRWMASWDCEWRSVALCRSFVRAKTLAAYADMFPDAPLAKRLEWLQARFVHAALEELEGHWLGMGKDPGLACEIDGLDELRAALAQGLGIVLVTFHYDAAIWGIGQLGRAGLLLSPMSSAVVEDARVPAAVGRYYRRKYDGLSALLNGGQVMHKEKHLPEFYRRLRRGHGVVVLGDAHATAAGKGVEVSFMGKRRWFASGALRLAQRCRAPLAAFVCLRKPSGFRIHISRICWPDAQGSHAANIAYIYGFLEGYVRAAPERWWAADLLPDFELSNNINPAHHALGQPKTCP